MIEAVAKQETCHPLSDENATLQHLYERDLDHQRQINRPITRNLWTNKKWFFFQVAVDTAVTRDGL